MIEIDYDWGDPPPRIKKRFGKKKAKEGKKKGKSDTRKDLKDKDDFSDADVKESP